ncbi:Protein kinase-like protein [Metarhizium robertsii ARSEF 23]|uniref:Protein kinase-like protein n=1 Tax=Metarhizium robertsii (strain ARSEF 23 / ATCC MYA-3075) TaxID=655844 RepID=A0A0B2XFL3_METRA|nr:Protein kinase-like protein [Metarhizium robertsii ARSEF 23]KHO11505.1 Protein kinase-like protein [Metarhizium robertsii ARSEF 23]
MPVLRYFFHPGTCRAVLQASSALYWKSITDQYPLAAPVAGIICLASIEAGYLYWMDNRDNAGAKDEPRLLEQLRRLESGVSRRVD